MKDRLKFRLWYEPEKKMMLFNNPTLLDGKVCSNDNGGLLFRNYDHNIKNVHECKPEDFSIMQCTGIKSKSGELIYEGDIVELEESVYRKLYKVYFQVVFENGSYYLKADFATNSGTLQFRCYLLGNYSGDAEVIGNIYENPELLQA